MKHTGLILCGGGLRGVYTAGVLDFFIDAQLNSPYVIGVSAGACNGFAYVAKQKGYAKILFTKYIKEKRYVSYRNFIRKRSIFDMDYLFDEIPKKLEKFNFSDFNRSNQRFIVTTTNCQTGQPMYFEKDRCKDIFMAIRASSSMPFLAPVVNMEGNALLDGGITDPIPIMKSIKDKNRKHIIVLTAHDKEMERRTVLKFLSRRVYPNYKPLIRSFIRIEAIYNRSLRYIKKLQDKNKAIIIVPSKTIRIKNLERNQDKMYTLYQLGYRDAKKSYHNIQQMISC